MKREKPKTLSYEIIATESGVSSRTVKRYFAGMNVTFDNVNAIEQAIKKLNSERGLQKKSEDKLISIKSLKLKENVFWSNPNGELPLKNILAAVVVGRNVSDLVALKKRFGSRKIRKVYSQISENKKNILASRIVNVL